MRFAAKEVWGRIPVGKNPQAELQKVADLLNGYTNGPDGSREYIPNFIPKKVKLVEEE